MANILFLFSKLFTVLVNNFAFYHLNYTPSLSCQDHSKISPAHWQDSGWFPDALIFQEDFWKSFWIFLIIIEEDKIQALCNQNIWRQSKTRKSVPSRWYFYWHWKYKEIPNMANIQFLFSKLFTVLVNIFLINNLNYTSSLSCQDHSKRSPAHWQDSGWFPDAFIFQEDFSKSFWILLILIVCFDSLS